MRRLFSFFILFCIYVSVSSQTYTRPTEWKKYRKEVFITVGTSNFLGDLGGRDKEGTHYSPADLDFPLTKTAFGAGFRYKVEKWFNVTGKFNYLVVRGDDAFTADIYRNNRNLNFKSNIFELTGRAEIGLSTSRSGNRYGIKKTLTTRLRNINHNFFGFVGVGAFYFNPKGRTAAGTYVPLRPLHTEGQGLPGGPKQYSKINVCIPFGVFYKININRSWSFGVEIAWRKTFTDYIDDVGTRYYDNATILAAYGPLAAQMADPNLGNIYGFSAPAADGLAAQRGNPQKDSYLSLEVTAGYLFKQKRKRAKLRSKF